MIPARSEPLYSIALTILAALFAACGLPNGADWEREVEASSPQSLVPGETGRFITNYDLRTYVPVPVEGAAPVKAVTSRRDVDVTVVWKDSGAFQPGTVYIVTVMLTAASGYTFSGAGHRRLLFR
ncbi:MAG: hypothetical protein LBK63_10435 [Treponema sp.]|nr:hypothetical protein [Treponema sp.]